MDLTLYLRKDRTDAAGAMPIHGRICWQGNKVRFSTGEWTEPDQWSDDIQALRPTTPGAKRVNRRLRSLTEGLEDFFENASRFPTDQQVRSEIERIKSEVLGHKAKAQPLPVVASTNPDYLPLLKWIPQYIAVRKADRSPEWARSMKAIMQHFSLFKPDFDWADLKLNTLNHFKVYLQEEADASDNTIAAYVGMIRGLCKYADRTDLPVPRSALWIEASTAEVVRPVLTGPEQTQLLNANLSSDSRRFYDPDLLERIRWFFLMACYTGLRRIDQSQFIDPTLTTIEGVPCLLALQQKTGRKVPIPLTDEAVYLLRNPVQGTKDVVYHQHYNIALKVVGEQAKLDRLVKVGSFYKGELLSDTMKLHETLASHTARRTFATRMTEAGLNIFVLQEIMGHQSINSTRKYATVSDTSIVEQTFQAWQRLKAA